MKISKKILSRGVWYFIKYFFFQGKELRNDERRCITSSEGISRLLIQNITADDSGKYDVSVENSYGTDNHFASVSVEGKYISYKLYNNLIVFFSLYQYSLTCNLQLS